MKRRHARLGSSLSGLVLGLISCLVHSGLALRAEAQVEAFRFEATRVPVGTVYEYLKTNRDGTHRSHVSLYVVSADRIESLKWSPGDTTAALVAAFIDWDRFSVRRFESYRLSLGAAPELRVTLDTDSSGAGVRVSLDPDVLLPIHRWPWHSYDFDLASLSFTLAHLVAPEASFTFERADVTYAETGPPFADLGPVHVRFLQREQRNGRATRLYELSGPGLQDRSGKLWAAVEGAHVVEFELPFGDEPGYTDVRFELQATRSLSLAEWESTKRERVGDSG